jgi:hypothetical protein
LKEDLAAREQVRELRARLEVATRRTVVDTTTTYTPTGKLAKKTVHEDTHADRVSDARVATATDTAVTSHTESTVERHRPDWRLGPMAGVDVRTGAFSFGGQVERRILGPFSAGAWGLSNGIVGLSLTVEF